MPHCTQTTLRVCDDLALNFPWGRRRLEAPRARSIEMLPSSFAECQEQYAADLDTVKSRTQVRFPQFRNFAILRDACTMVSFYEEWDSREISRALVLKPLWQSKAVLGTARDIFVLDRAFALIEGHRRRSHRRFLDYSSNALLDYYHQKAACVRQHGSVSS